jgi:hypothetical protein
METQAGAHSRHELQMLPKDRTLTDPRVVAQQQDRRRWVAHERLGEEFVDLKPVVLPRTCVELPNRLLIFREHVWRTSRETNPRVVAHGTGPRTSRAVPPVAELVIERTGLSA